MEDKITTVTGKISIEKMGLTLPHEHIFWDLRDFLSLPEERNQRDLLRRKISVENRGDVVYRCMEYEDNLYFEDKTIALNELKKFKDSGGSTIIDLTLKNIGRNPRSLIRDI